MAGYRAPAILTHKLTAYTTKLIAEQLQLAIDVTLARIKEA
ncbi:MAG: hypothetical protein ACK52I_13565 [Pseudomonadota bacterium]|jgi:hypothetical protein